MSEDTFYEIICSPDTKLSGSAIDALMLLLLKCQELELKVAMLTAYTASKESCK